MVTDNISDTVSHKSKKRERRTRKSRSTQGTNTKVTTSKKDYRESASKHLENVFVQDVQATQDLDEVNEPRMNDPTTL